eukprot:258783_1
MAGFWCIGPSFFWLFIQIMIVIYMSITIYRHVKHRGNNVHPVLYYTGLAYFILIEMFMVLWVIRLPIYCMKPELFIQTQSLHSIMYMLQFWFVMIVLFVRMIYAFKGSLFHVTRLQMIGYSICYLIFVICSVLVLVSFNNTTRHTITGWIFMALYITSFISLNVILMYMFISKLIMAQRQLATSNKYETDFVYLGVITRLCLLTLLSIISTTMFLVTVNLKINYFVFVTFGTIDQISNFVSISWGYRIYVFQKDYDKVCGLCDAKCRQLFGGSMGPILPTSSATNIDPSAEAHHAAPVTPQTS